MELSNAAPTIFLFQKKKSRAEVFRSFLFFFIDCVYESLILYIIVFLSPSHYKLKRILLY